MKGWAWEFRFLRKCWRLCIRGEIDTLNGESLFLESLFIHNHSCAFAVSQSQGVDRNVMKYLLCSMGLRTTRPYCSDSLFSSEMKTCQPGYFQCQSGHCVPEHLTCDGIADCLDASDEAACRKCPGPAALFV